MLNAAAGYLQREVGRRIRMKFTPRFRFTWTPERSPYTQSS